MLGKMDLLWTSVASLGVVKKFVVVVIDNPLVVDAAVTPGVAAELDAASVLVVAGEEVLVVVVEFVVGAAAVVAGLVVVAGAATVVVALELGVDVGAATVVVALGLVVVAGADGLDVPAPGVGIWLGSVAELVGAPHGHGFGRWQAGQQWHSPRQMEQHSQSLFPHSEHSQLQGFVLHSLHWQSPWHSSSGLPQVLQQVQPSGLTF